MAISDNLRAIRIKKGLTQKQVAEACGLARSTILTYETGNANPKPVTVAKLAKALDVSPSVLYGVDWVPGIEIPDQETASALYQSFLTDKGGALPLEDTSKALLLAVFDKLNESGQQEALKRLDEMAVISQYQKSGNLSALAKVLLQYVTYKRGTGYAIADEETSPYEECEFDKVRHIVMEPFAPEKSRQLDFWCYFIRPNYDNYDYNHYNHNLVEEIVNHHDTQERWMQDYVVFFDQGFFDFARTLLDQRYTNDTRDSVPSIIVLYIGLDSTGELSVLDETSVDEDYYDNGAEPRSV